MTLALHLTGLPFVGLVFFSLLGVYGIFCLKDDDDEDLR